MDRPVQVNTSLNGTSTTFSYAPDGSRTRQVVSGWAEGKYGPRTVYSIDKDYELTVWQQGGVTEERSYLGPSTIVYRSGSQRTVLFTHKDRLGSLDAVTLDDPAASEYLVDGHGYDPWGKPRAREWTSSQERLHPGGEQPWTMAAATDRGFTGHEHLDAHHLIHMNGRVYDFRLGRFLSVDPIIGNPLNPQTVNPYSYIGNHPLSGTDPTGFESDCTKATGSNVCGAEPIGNLTVNGNPVTPGSNTLLGAVKDYLKQACNGAKPDNGNNAATPDKGGLSDTPKGPSVEGLKDWIGEKRAELKGAFESAFRKAFSGLNPYRESNEIYAEARQDSAQRADALGTGMGGAAYDLAETVGKEGAILVVGGVAEKGAAAGLRAIRAARGATAAEGGVAVLGHYPGYVTTAETIGARYFNVPAEVWARMSPAEQWVANVKFLDRLISRGDTVVLSTPASAARAGSWFVRELEYLSSRDYSLSADGMRMLPRGPQ